jgi:putative spermidine/putrescine transport system substrate-binding protein
MMKRYLIIGVVMSALLAACGGDTETTTTAGATETTAGATETTVGATETTAGSTDTTVAAAGGMEELIAAAQEEGTLTTIALPHDWCGYGAVIDGFKAKYGLEVNELDPGAGSAEELEAIAANEGNPGPQAPDVIDVGLAFGPQAMADGLIQPYKVSTWDDIPEGAKDPDGNWYGDYYGVLSLEVNTAEVANPPAEYADLLNPEYAGQVALSGDPLTSNAAILTVWAAGLATGATGVEAAQAGLEYFAELNDAGNFVPIDGDSRTVGIGETPILVDWSYNSIANDVALAGNPDIETVVPEAGRMAGVYVQAISAFAPHPNAAKLWMEYLYSDEGQLGWAAGFCHPIRFEAMSAAGTIPAEVAEQLPSTEGAFFPTIEEITAASDVIVAGWPEVVGVTVAESTSG